MSKKVCNCSMFSIVPPSMQSQLQRTLGKLVSTSFRTAHVPIQINVCSEMENKIQRGIQRNRPVDLRSQITKWKSGQFYSQIRMNFLQNFQRMFLLLPNLFKGVYQREENKSEVSSLKPISSCICYYRFLHPHFFPL